MSTDHVMTKDPSKCCAFGCPMPGSLTQSTVGTTEWFCWFHFGKEAVHWQAITTELNRMGWLVDALVGMRRDYMRFRTQEWDQAYLTALQAIRVNQREDLEKLEDETVQQWFRRIENELARACQDVAVVPTKQARIGQKQGGFQKVAFELPESA